MCKIICITNRALCREAFLQRLERIAAGGADAVILREKDLPEPEYAVLAEKAAEICQGCQVPLILHSFPQSAAKCKAAAVQLPLPVLRGLSPERREQLSRFGVSCHAVSEAQEAEAAGASYLIAGHIFATDCKKGLPGRGLPFLHDVCSSVQIPVYAIGGMTPERVPAVLDAGAAGVCVMSGLMQCDDPADLIRRLKGERQDGI
ncbi:MAG: thiamine phosphate synthase [Oscillospiraceae bacterium]|nr:thiamine phosphate synthase [Oscillospiraceae bacterium]